MTLKSSVCKLDKQRAEAQRAMASTPGCRHMDMQVAARRAAADGGAIKPTQ